MNSRCKTELSQNHIKLKTLLENSSRWPTNMGGWTPGEDVKLRGKSLLKELNHLPWISLVLFSITGKIPESNQRELYEGIWVISTSFPDPRLWNNRIAALAANARSTPVLGISAGIAVSEATIYGHRPLVATIDFLYEVQRKLDEGGNLNNILETIYQSPSTSQPGKGKHRRPAKIPGFGRPITPVDERRKPLLDLAERCNFSQGKILLLALNIEQALVNIAPQLKMNIATLMAALCADQGMSPREFYYFVSLCFSAGILACAIDAEAHSEGSFFPLPCSAIQYSGKARRQWGSS